jgi:hypothetical protein
MPQSPCNSPEFVESSDRGGLALSRIATQFVLRDWLGNMAREGA